MSTSDFDRTLSPLLVKCAGADPDMILCSYSAVCQLSAYNSEGLSIEELQTTYPGVLREGSTGPAVSTVQYYLSYISLFVPTVQSVSVDGNFGPATRESVISYQKTYNLSQSGEIDAITWNSIENTYYSIISGVPYNFEQGLILPFPGRVLRVGVDGNDVRALQEYLNYISNTYTSIPKVTVDGSFGPSTAAAVRAFVELFGLSGNPERVSASIWNSIISVYDDLYVGNIVNDEQFPGYGINGG